MFKIVLSIHKFLYQKEKSKYLFFLFLSLAAVFLESLGYISLVPLVTVLINPSYLENSIILQKLYIFFNAENNYNFIIKYGIFSIIFFTIGSTTIFLNSALQVRFVNKIVMKTRLELLSNYLNKDLLFHKNNNSSNLISKLFTQIDEISQSTIFGFFEYVTRCFSVLIFIILLMLVDLKLTFYASIFLFLFYYFVDLKLKKSIQQVASTLYNSNLKALSYATETIKLFREIIHKKQKEFFLNRFFTELNQIYKARNFVRIIPRFSRFFIETFAIGSLVSLILLIYIKEKDVSIFLESIIYFVLAVYKIFPNLNSCFQIIINLKSGFVQLSNIINDLEIKDVQNVSNKKQLFKKNIEFKNVNFSYNNKEILKKININLEKNKTTLIYGKSGSGKSTICDLISGRLQPNSGELLIDGQSINFSNSENIFHFFAYVGQEALILNENYYRNISLEENFDKQKVEKAARISRIDEFIKNKTDGFNDVISENGKNLSGGQKQRIAIARAIYTDPEILILDEATSNLDIKIESEIYELIYKQFSDKTKIIITHRLSDHLKFDHCYKIEDGSVIYDGENLN